MDMKHYKVNAMLIAKHRKVSNQEDTQQQKMDSSDELATQAFYFTFSQLHPPDPPSWRALHA